jgi:hypothetical protein
MSGRLWIFFFHRHKEKTKHELPDQYRTRGYSRLAGKIYVWIEPPSAQEVFFSF